MASVKESSRRHNPAGRDVSRACARDVQSQGQRDKAKATTHFRQLGVAPTPFRAARI